MRSSEPWIACLALAGLSLASTAGRAVQRELRWSNGDVELVGELRLPAGEGPHPAAVVLHGAGSADRTEGWAGAWASALIAEGVAVLLPDKRGGGASGGDWRQADFEDLAWDALTGVKLLRSLPEIDGRRVGLLGLSEGAHAAAAAAAQDASLAFVVEVSGGAATVADTAAWRVESGLRAGGASEDAVTRGLELLGVANELARGRGDWDRYLTLRRAVEREAGEAAVASFPETRTDPHWAWWGRVVDFDPMTWWWTVDVPVLFLFGSDDADQPTRVSVDRIQRSMVPEGLDVTVRVLEGAGHTLGTPAGGLRPDARRALGEFLRGVR